MSIFATIAGSDTDTHPSGPWLFDGAIFVHVAYRIEAKIAKEEGIAGSDNLPATSTAPRLSSMIRAMLDRFEPASGLVAWDGGKTWRHELDPAYKAHRPPKPPGLVELLAVAPKVFEQGGIQSVSVPGYEADDVIASAVYRHDHCVIVSNDKDFFQLFGVRGARQWDPLKRRHAAEAELGALSKSVLVATDVTAPAGTWVTAQDVLEKFGVDVTKTSPKTVIDVQALIGDAADGVPGCPGIGPVAALDIMRHFHNITHLYGTLAGQNPDPLTDEQKRILNKYGEKLRGGREKVERSRRLVALSGNLVVQCQPITRPSTGLGAFLNPLGEQHVNPLASILGTPKPAATPAPSLKDQLNAAARVDVEEPPAPPMPPAEPNPDTVLKLRAAAAQYLAAKYPLEKTKVELAKWNAKMSATLRLADADFEAVVDEVYGVVTEPPPPPAPVEVVEVVEVVEEPPAPPMPDAIEEEPPPPIPSASLLNPPDGVPAHLPATEYAPGGALDPARKAKKDTVPDGFGAWSGRTWPSLDKDDSIQFRAELRAKLSPTQASEHKAKTACPEKGAKRTEIQADARLLVSILTGEALTTGEDEAPPAPVLDAPPTPDATPAPKPATISVRELDAKQRAECLRDYAMGRKAGNSRNALRADMIEAFPEVKGLEIEWACAQAMGPITGLVELNNAIDGHKWELDARAGFDVEGIARALFKLCNIDGLDVDNVEDRLSSRILETDDAPAPLPVEELPPMPSEEKAGMMAEKAPRPLRVPDVDEDEPEVKTLVGTVYVDCMPLKEVTVSLVDLVAGNGWDHQVADELKVAHYLIADYRKGSRGIAAYLSRAIEDGELRGIDLVVMTSASYAPECLEVLEPVAFDVVRRVG